MGQQVVHISADEVWKILNQVMDPEVPVLSVIDLGIIRKITLLPPLGGQGVEVSAVGQDVEVTITPTYSGCPAMDVISMNIKMELISHGFNNVIIKQVLSPAWTTAWMTESGKEKLRAYGIAPPNPKQQVCNQDLFAAAENVQCPHCQSFHTRRISEFGSTACKSLYQCNDCLEPFDYFKCH